MKDCDLREYEKVFPRWEEKVRGQIHRILLLSPSGEQRHLINRLFPGAYVAELSHTQWDLNHPGQEDWDLIGAMNVFMCSPDPTLWFKHVLSRCKYFWIQDLIRARRNGAEECAKADGDLTRYCYLPAVTANIPDAYDLSRFSDRLVDFHTYVSTGQDGALSFLMSLKGDLLYNPSHDKQDPVLPSSGSTDSSSRLGLLFPFI